LEFLRSFYPMLIAVWGLNHHLPQFKVTICHNTFPLLVVYHSNDFELICSFRICFLLSEYIRHLFYGAFHGLIRLQACFGHMSHWVGLVIVIIKDLVEVIVVIVAIVVIVVIV